MDGLPSPAGPEPGPLSDGQSAALAAELNHRVLNTLTVVQSLARQTFAPGGDALAQQRAFTERLRALCAVHRLLGRNRWAYAHLRCTLEIALAPHPFERWALDGPVVALEPEAAIDLAMVFDELATNAAQHGALSGPRGKVEVSWRSEGGRVIVTWRERDGARPPSLTRWGFGLRLVNQVVKRQLGGSLHVEAAEDGLVWRIEVATRRA